jgi:hypothetical protein
MLVMNLERILKIAVLIHYGMVQYNVTHLNLLINQCTKTKIQVVVLFLMIPLMNI